MYTYSKDMQLEGGISNIVTLDQGRGKGHTFGEGTRRIFVTAYFYKYALCIYTKFINNSVNNVSLKKCQKRSQNYCPMCHNMQREFQAI
jgi:hypothetical protein